MFSIRRTFFRASVTLSLLGASALATDPNNNSNSQANNPSNTSVVTSTVRGAGLGGLLPIKAAEAPVLIITPSNSGVINVPGYSTFSFSVSGGKAPYTFKATTSLFQVTKYNTSSSSTKSYYLFNDAFPVVMQAMSKSDLTNYAKSKLAAYYGNNSNTINYAIQNMFDLYDRWVAYNAALQQYQAGMAAYQKSKGPYPNDSAVKDAKRAYDQIYYNFEWYVAYLVIAAKYAELRKLTLVPPQVPYSQLQQYCQPGGSGKNYNPNVNSPICTDYQKGVGFYSITVTTKSTPYQTTAEIDKDNKTGKGIYVTKYIGDPVITVTDSSKPENSAKIRLHIIPPTMRVNGIVEPGAKDGSGQQLTISGDNFYNSTVQVQGSVGTASAQKTYGDKATIRFMAPPMASVCGNVNCNPRVVVTNDGDGQTGSTYFKYLTKKSANEPYTGWTANSNSSNVMCKGSSCGPFWDHVWTKSFSCSRSDAIVEAVDSGNCKYSYPATYGSYDGKPKASTGSRSTTLDCSQKGGIWIGYAGASPDPMIIGGGYIKCSWWD